MSASKARKPEGAARRRAKDKDSGKRTNRLVMLLTDAEHAHVAAAAKADDRPLGPFARRLLLAALADRE